jgi:S1-C subfamily serine protease
VTSSTSRTTLFVAGLIAALGLGIGVGAATFAIVEDDEPAAVAADTTETETTETETTSTTATAEGLSIADIYDRTSESVVEIAASTSAGGGQSAQGSGFVYDVEGHVITNQHVVAGAGEVNVRFSNGSSYAASVVGTDGSTDLAVLRVDAPAALLQPLELGDSSAVREGDAVVALGSPFGLEGTITSGIVSALHRQMTAPNNFTITDSIQTDAAINHGNSGGPLLDANGRVIGVNAQIESESGGNDGVGFAIPSNTVRRIADQLIETGVVEHAYLGVSLVTVEDGVAIESVRDGTPADEAGLQPATGSRIEAGVEVPTGGDVVVEIDGVPISTSGQLQSAVAAKRPGDTVTIVVLRDGDRREVEVTLAKQPPTAS